MYLELLIEKNNKEEFIAKCPMFPKCKGIDLNKEDAINKLCSSITRYISKTTSRFLKEKLLSNNYSEIIINPKKSDTFQHRVIDLLPKTNTNNHQVFLKSLKELSITKDDIKTNTVDSLETHVNSLLKQTNNTDDQIFGISLCMN